MRCRLAGGSAFVACSWSARLGEVAKDSSTLPAAAVVKVACFSLDADSSLAACEYATAASTAVSKVPRKTCRPLLQNLA